MSSDRILRAEDIHKVYDLSTGLRRSHATVDAVSGVSFDIGRGETLALVGESGCGKSTIARMIVGLERPTAGRLEIDGVDVADGGRRARRARARRVQLMFQDSSSALDPTVAVGSTVLEPLAIHRIGTRASREKRARELFSEVGLSGKSFDRLPHEFSGGQRQRLGLARALALNPPLVVADEPVSSLDVSIRAQIISLMNRLKAERGLSYLLITHDLSVVRHMAERLAVMYLGVLVEIGPTEQVIDDPVHPYTRGLLDVVPVPDPVVARANRRPAISGELPSALAPPTGCRFHPRCPRASEICRTVRPTLTSFDAAHQAACHHPLRPATS